MAMPILKQDGMSAEARLGASAAQARMRDCSGEPKAKLTPPQNRTAMVMTHGLGLTR
ncbi:hypothetical protein D3C72_2458960 [compost metagenome]